MLHPLASLWRHSGRVTFYESGGQVGQSMLQGGGFNGAAHAIGSRRRFASSDDAATYLRYWMGEPAARAELKWILQRSGPSLASANAGADGWLHALAARMTSGAIVVLEEHSRQAMPGRLVAPPAAGASAAAAAAVAALPALADVAAIPAVLDLLPVLEDIRIEGAEVLPELDQSIEQVEAAIASVSAAALSLDPAPAGIADIVTAIADASAEATADLEAL